MVRHSLLHSNTGSDVKNFGAGRSKPPFSVRVGGGFYLLEISPARLVGHDEPMKVSACRDATG